MECKKNAWTIFQRYEGKYKNNTWMRKGDLKGCTEALICSAQERSIYTNYIKYNIDKTGTSPL